MMMWIKQFIRGTHEQYWEYAFADNNQEIVEGDCDDILTEYFDREEAAEITDAGPDDYNETEDLFYQSQQPHTHIWNSVNKDGKRIGYTKNIIWILYGHPSQVTGSTAHGK